MSANLAGLWPAEIGVQVQCPPPVLARFRRIAGGQMGGCEAVVSVGLLMPVADEGG